MNGLVTAVDIGTSKVTVCVASLDENNNYKIVKLVKEPFESKDEQKSRYHAANALNKAIKEVQKDGGPSIQSAYFCVSSPSLKISDKKDSVTLGKYESKTITENELNLAIQRAGKVKSGGLEGRVLHIMPISYFLDNMHEVRNPLGMHSTELGITSRVVSCASEDVDKLAYIAKTAGIGIKQMVASVITGAGVALTEPDIENGALYIDIGEKKTYLAAYYGGIPVFIDSLSVGASSLTKDLSVGYGISEAEAEELKITYGGLMPKKGDDAETIQLNPGSASSVNVKRKEIVEVLKARMQEIFSLVIYKLDGADLKLPQFKRVVLAGGGGGLEGIEMTAKFALKHAVELAKTGVESSYEITPSEIGVVGTIDWAVRNIGGTSFISEQTPSGADMVKTGKNKNIFMRIVSKIIGRK